MTCSDFIQHFSDYIDDRDGSGILREAERHLDRCEECRRYAEVYERGRDLLRGFPEVEVRDDFQPRLRHRIYDAEERAALAAESGSGATAATAFGMAALLVVAAWSPSLSSGPAAIELAPIVVSTPAPRSLGLRPSGSFRPTDGAGSRTFREESPRRWRTPNDLLFRFSPLGTSGSAEFRRTGLD